MHKKFQDLLHSYKVEVFHQEHDKKSHEELARECMQVSEEVLQQNYHYHFHKLPDADRAEIINMINNYTREALLPPIVESIVKRQLVLEHRYEALVNMIEKMLELLSTAPAAAGERSS